MTRVLQSLNQALHQMMESDPTVFVIGEDILDPYGGAFKVTKGLSSKFSDRVISTPISEAGIVGLGAGLAMRGYKSVVEIMFGDFVTLIADQMINQVSKMTWMYNQRVQVNLVVRTPMGGRRGYGPTHSQSLEKLFLGVPGITVAAVSNVYDPGRLLATATLTHGAPVFLVENKLLYAEAVLDDEQLREQHGLVRCVDDAELPTVTLSSGSEPDLTIVTYGGMVPLVLKAARRLKDEEELELEIVVPHQLSAIDMLPIVHSVKKSRRVVVVEEGILEWGWGSEVTARIGCLELEAPAQRVGSVCTPIPASRSQEEQTLPQVDDIISAAIRTVDQGYD